MQNIKNDQWNTKTRLILYVQYNLGFGGYFCILCAYALYWRLLEYEKDKVSTGLILIKLCWKVVSGVSSECSLHKTDGNYPLQFIGHLAPDSKYIWHSKSIFEAKPKYSKQISNSCIFSSSSKSNNFCDSHFFKLIIF